MRDPPQKNTFQIYLRNLYNLELKMKVLKMKIKS